MSGLHLFGIPYAGGSAAAIYGRWARHLPKHIKVVPLELAGHGRRMGEPFHKNMVEVVDDLYNVVRPIAKTYPYAIYGHSMGCVIAYELVKKLELASLPSPRTLFLSGRNPPHDLYTRNPLHLMSDDVFLEEIRKLGGTPGEFFEMKGLIDVFLPIIRNDYCIIERYMFSPPSHVMNTDLVFLHSDRDALVAESKIPGWQRYCTGNFDIKKFSGGHFFIHDHGERICLLIADAIASTMARGL